MQSSDDLLSARDTARRLGIKLDTLYAYVSRGLLQSVAVTGSRERRYRPEDVERFRLGRGAERPREALIPVIDSAISLIDNGRFYYRGRDALALADTATLEEVAALLWQSTSPQADPDRPPVEFDGSVIRNRRSVAAPAAASGVIERCQIRLAAISASDAAAFDLTRHGVVATGRAILSALVACIAGVDADDRPVHRCLAACWRLEAAAADLVRRCLVLVADHELNASTFVARCVASTGATPYAVVAAALAALSGRRHGGASARAEAMFREIGENPDPLPAMAARLARGDSLPGLGQPLYPDGDPRARAILAAIGAAAPRAAPRIAAAAAAASRLTGEYPNLDFALAAAATALGLPNGAALGLFVVGRTVGWIAHAIEQYENPMLIRPRARYTGPRPA
ncbi:MAG TPA: citrate synthase family protein [Stellaceae bacterium]|nr:citrate synthase family protein [Stellaceae bacterium]